jgi:hypothetical protein
MTITVKIKSYYGQEYIYPVCEKAKLLSSLTGTKTFTRSHIDHIKRLGYRIDVQQDTRSL